MFYDHEWADCVAQGRGLPHEHGTVPFLQYVGDIILLAPGPRQLGAMANYLVAQLRAVGFVLSDDKTQWAATSSVHRRSIKVNGTTIHALPTSSTLNALASISPPTVSSLCMKRPDGQRWLASRTRKAVSGLISRYQQLERLHAAAAACMM